MKLCDYLYADVDKVVSLYSQLTGGIVETREQSTANKGIQDNKRQYSFKVFSHDAGGSTEQHTSVRVMEKPHHALFADLEMELDQKGCLLNFPFMSSAHSLKDGAIRTELQNRLCLKVTGRAVFEDYSRLKDIAEAFPEIIKIIGKSQQSAFLESSPIKDTMARMRELEENIKKTKDSVQKSRMRHELNSTKEVFDTALKSLEVIGGVDQWILDALKRWIDTFYSGIFNIRLYPNPSAPDEHVIGHLRPSSFDTLTSPEFHFTYGTVPTEPITMIGIVTSVPTADQDSFQPLGEFECGEVEDVQGMERGFRGIFQTFITFENMMRTSRYPRVLVRPVVVYRAVDVAE